MCETASEANDHQIANSDSIVQELQTIFTDRAIEDLHLAAAQSSDIHAAVDIVLDQQMGLSSMASDPAHPEVSTEHKTKEVTTLQQILKQVREESLTNQEIKISVDRDEIWRCGLLFYKKCINDPNRLKMSFDMKFTGLTGEQSSMDAVALSYEVCGALPKEASFRLLEGKEENLVPKRSGGNVTNFVILGMLVGHSLLNGGPCLAVMAPWVYDMTGGKMTFDDIATKITKDIIPINAASSSTIQMIELLDKCNDNASINAILDTPMYLQITSDQIGRSLVEFSQLLSRKMEFSFTTKKDSLILIFIKSTLSFSIICRLGGK